MRGTLRLCPECGGSWPKGPDHALRACGWLAGLDREVSPSNNDVLVHDGAHGRDRFLQLEIKRRAENWPPAGGQLWTLRALAKQSNWTVLILRGDTRSVDVHQVDPGGIREPIKTHTEALRRAINSWLRGALWRDAEAILAASPSKPDRGHTCGWARVDGVWTCVQDHYAVGFRTDTACGATLPQFP